MKKYDELLRIAGESGAQRTVIVNRPDIVCDPVFHDICASNACGQYGRCWMCPPGIGAAEKLIADISRCSGGVMYQNVYPLEDSFDYEGMVEARRQHHACSARIHAHLSDDMLHLSVGGCGVCGTCAQREGEPCRYPDKAIASLEAYCVNVHDTAENVGLKYINGQDTVTYFGMILFKEDLDA